MEWASAHFRLWLLMSSTEFVTPEPDERDYTPYKLRNGLSTYICDRCGHHFLQGRGRVIGAKALCYRYGCAQEEYHGARL